MKRSRGDSEATRLNKRRRVVKTLESMGSVPDETFGEYEIDRFQEGLKKAVRSLAKWNEGDRADKRGLELVTLMRDAARWHRDRYAKCLSEFKRLDANASQAKSEEHVNATEDLFGIVLDRGDSILMTVARAERQVLNRFPDEEKLLEEFDECTKELNETRETRYRTFNADQMDVILEVCRFEGCSSKWCTNMRFWK